MLEITSPSNGDQLRNIFSFDEAAAARLYAAFVTDQTVIDCCEQHAQGMYAALALGEELGELCGKVTSTAINESRDRDTLLELGDVAFYVFLLASNFGIDPIQFGFRRRWQSALSRADRVTLAMQLAVTTGGHIQGLVKKLHRDSAGIATPEMISTLTGDLHKLVSYLSTIAYFIGYAPDDVMAENINKILSRKARGTLAGSGDHR